jgi:hypothetical protein
MNSNCFSLVGLCGFILFVVVTILVHASKMYKKCKKNMNFFFLIFFFILHCVNLIFILCFMLLMHCSLLFCVILFLFITHHAYMYLLPYVFLPLYSYNLFCKFSEVDQIRTIFQFIYCTTPHGRGEIQYHFLMFEKKRCKTND